MSFENLESLRKALLEISSECSKHECCLYCPFKKLQAEGRVTCGIVGEHEAPRYWSVIGEAKLKEKINENNPELYLLQLFHRD